MKFSLLTALLFLLLGSGCQPEPEEDLLLDCLLEVFIDNFPSDSSEVVIVNEIQMQADTSTTFMFSFYSRKYLYAEYNCVQNEFKGRTILYTSEALSNYADSSELTFDETCRVKTSLEWEPFDPTGLRSNRDFITPPYHPTQVHIILDNRYQYSQGVILVEAPFKECFGLDVRGKQPPHLK